jgi:drug/metabolite transporter (DMT)-like permease
MPSQMAAVALAFASSVSWGVADFVGGVKSRALPVLNVILASQLTGLVLIATFVAVRGEGAPGGDFAAFAALSALAGVSGLAAFYRALAVGNMGVVAPISACAAVVPVVVGIATGDRPGTLQAIGLALALVGVVLASREEIAGERAGGRRTARGAGLAIVSALGFGFFFLAIDRASDADVPWAMLVNRMTGVSLLLAAVLVLRPPLRAGRRDAPALIMIGTLDTAANGTFALASTKGLVSVVSVLGSLYPLTTVGLAALVLHERPHRLAQAGVVVALLGVCLIAAG